MGFVFFIRVMFQLVSTLAIFGLEQIMTIRLIVA